MEQRKSYDKILKYSVTAKCTEPLHIGSASGAKEEVLVHPVDDIPFIQATSIAGVFRGYYEQTYGEEKAAELFGHRRFKEKTSNKNTIRINRFLNTCDHSSFLLNKSAPLIMKNKGTFMRVIIVKHI